MNFILKFICKDFDLNVLKALHFCIKNKVLIITNKLVMN